MIRLSLKDYSQRFFKALIWGWCYYALFASSVQAAEEDPVCVNCQKESPGISSQSFENITTVNTVLMVDPQQNCFDQLTDNDRAFLEYLFKKISEHCGVEEVAVKPKPKTLAPLKRLPASNAIELQLEKVSPECAVSAQSMMFKEIEEYGKGNGTAAKKRVSIAMVAQLQRLQIANILRDFEDAFLASSFHKFTEAIYNYDQSLKRVMHQALNTNKGDSPNQKGSILSWLYQRGSMAKDLFLTKTNLSDKTRFREHEKAAEKLLFSGIALNKKIQNSTFSKEKKANLINQVNILNNLMRGRYNQTQNSLNEEAQVATLATGGFISAVLVVASLGSFSPALLWAGPAADFLSASLSMTVTSAIGVTGVRGIVETSNMILGSKAAAKDNASRFLCELAKKMNNEGEKSLETIWEAALTTAQISGVVGGAANLLSRHSKIREYEILMGVLGAFIGLNVVEVKSKLEKADENTGEQAHARLLYEAGKISYGELIDKTSEVNQKEANNNAELIGKAVNIPRLIYFTKDVGKSITTEKVKNEALLKVLKNLELQSGRTFTTIQNKAAMNLFNLKIKNHENLNKFSEQEAKVINDLKNAGFTPNEIRSILNVNITTIIPSSSNSNLNSSD